MLGGLGGARVTSHMVLCDIPFGPLVEKASPRIENERKGPQCRPFNAMFSQPVGGHSCSAVTGRPTPTGEKKPRKGHRIHEEVSIGCSTDGRLGLQWNNLMQRCVGCP